MAGSRTLLIVEDDMELAETLEFLLGKIGYSVRTAKDGAEGLKIWEEEHPRAVLLDINLPDMDGYEVCRRIKEIPSRRYNTAVLFLTARDEKELRTKGSAACADFYIRKPVDPNDLGVDLYELFEKGFNLEPEEIYRLRVTKQVPPNTDAHPFSEQAAEEEPLPEPPPVRPTVAPKAAVAQPSRTQTRPAAVRTAKTQSAMQLDQVKDLLLALKESLGRTRNRLTALLNYIDQAGR